MTKNVNLRLDDGLHAQVKDAAGQDDRSLNSEITWLLKMGLEARANSRVIRNVKLLAWGPDPTGLGEILSVRDVPKEEM